MQVNVTFRHMDPTPALKSYAADKVEKVAKYLTRAFDAHVVLSVERHNHKADININELADRYRAAQVVEVAVAKAEEIEDDGNHLEGDAEPGSPHEVADDA